MATETQDLFKCRECGHEQKTILQQENHTRFPSGFTHFEEASYIFECGHLEEFSDKLLTVAAHEKKD